VRAVTELLLLRHAKAADGPRDALRALAERGCRDAPRIGRWLEQHDLVPDRVLCSPAVRTRQTAALVLAECGDAAPTPRPDDRLYLPSVTTLFEVLLDLGAGARRLLVVGHNPGLSDLVEVLCGTEVPADPDTGVVFPTAGLAHLTLDGDVTDLAPRCAELTNFVRARQLFVDDAP